MTNSQSTFGSLTKVQILLGPNTKLSQPLLKLDLEKRVSLGMAH